MNNKTTTSGCTRKQMSIRTWITAMLIVMTIVMYLPASAESKKSDYSFRRIDTPKSIETYSTTAFVGGNHTVTTMRGDELTKRKEKILGFALNPTSVSYAIVTENNKGEKELTVWNTRESERRLYKFDSKTNGMPSAVAFDPEGRYMAVSTPGMIRLIELKKYKPVGEISLVPVSPNKMLISPNGYFLVLVDGSKIVVYNIEDRSIRFRTDCEVDVSDVAFSPDSQQLGILTSDGLLSLYSTRTFDLATMVDDLGEGSAFDFNKSGKYIAVAIAPDNIKVLNLLKQSDSEDIEVPERELYDLAFITDASDKEVLVYGSFMNLLCHRMGRLEPYYAKLVSDEVDLKMAEWLKMQPGESMEAYSARISDENRKKQRRLFEDEISTSLAGDMMSMAGMSLGKYNKDQELLEVDFTNMPSIYLPVSKSDVIAFKSSEDLTVSDTQYGLLPDDSFELIYAKFHNRNDGKIYVYDNLDRVAMTFLDDDSNLISLELLQQQQMEEMKLQEIKENVVREARHDNVISDHTQIVVDSRVVPDYDAAGNKILNYVVRFTYQVDPGFSVTEDFGPGKYHVDESGAAQAMLAIVRKAFEGDFSQYVKDDGKVKITITGSADSTPIVKGIPYDGVYGDFVDEPVYHNGQLTTLTVTPSSGIKTNEQLAFLRAAGVKDYLDRNVAGLEKMKQDVRYNIGVSPDKGSEFRRIETEFTFVDVF